MDGFLRTDSATSGASLVGKIPARADFVRFGASTPESQEFDAWLVRAIERLHLTGRTYPDRVYRFVHRASARARGVMGVLAPSRDRMGRRFPVAIVHGVGAGGEGARSAGLEAPFLETAAAAARELSALSAEQIDPWLAALAQPRGSQPGGSGVDLDAVGAHAFLDAAFGPGSDAMQSYGLLTFARAAQSVRSGSPNAAPPLLDCPVTDRASAQLWLELAARLLPSHGLSFIYSDDAPQRLLLAWGGLADEALGALADPRFSSRTLWPFTTDRAAAVERAVTTVAPALAELTRTPPSSLNKLLGVLSRLQQS